VLFAHHDITGPVILDDVNYRRSPQTEAQIAFVMNWEKHDPGRG
jgi:hypothetical protein